MIVLQALEWVIFSALGLFLIGSCVDGFLRSLEKRKGAVEAEEFFEGSSSDGTPVA